MWPVFFNVLSVLGCFLSILAAISAAQSAIRVRELLDQLQVFPTSRLRLLETSLTETREGLEEVANRVKMMRVRNAANHTSEKSADPDPYRDPEAWRRAMNRKLADRARGA